MISWWQSHHENHYFCNISDYLNYGLLRTLAGTGGFRIGVAWMLPPEDGRSDEGGVGGTGGSGCLRGRDGADGVDPGGQLTRLGMGRPKVAFPEI